MVVMVVMAIPHRHAVALSEAKLHDNNSKVRALEHVLLLNMPLPIDVRWRENSGGAGLNTRD